MIARLRGGIASTVGALRRWVAGPAPDTGPMDAWTAPYTANPLFVRLAEREQLGGRYTWPAIQAAKLAGALGLPRISMIEFGVAGGHGLLHLEQLARRLEPEFGVSIDVYGFDTGTGLPAPRDHRDLPNLWSEGAFPMDVAGLRARLTRATLVLGPVAETVPAFLAGRPAPVAFAAFDLDLYSSTRDALGLFDADASRLLPRVHCFFDDILGYTFCEFNGERLAIDEFNAAHPARKIALIPGLRHFVPTRFASSSWWERCFLLHDFGHPLYGRPDRNIDATNPMLRLRP